MAYSFLKLAEEVLQDAEVPLTCRQIWDIGKNRGLSQRVDTQYNPPWVILSSRLCTQVIHDSENSKFDRLPGRPKRYFLKSRQNEMSGKDTLVSLTETNESVQQTSYKEIDIHPLLASYVFTNTGFFGEMEIRTKTIDHRTTSKIKKYSEWMHPDMVGVYAPFDDMEAPVIELSRFFNSDSMFYLFSFEIKIAIDRANYRECFFQAVSNSSWAHGGYLVAAEIDDDEEFRRELGRLSNSFGIGIIHLDVHNFNATQVLCGVEPKPELDWERINQLCRNKDFYDFIKQVKIDFNAGKIHDKEYDAVIGKPISYIRDTLKIETKE